MCLSRELAVGNLCGEETGIGDGYTNSKPWGTGKFSPKRGLLTNMAARELEVYPDFKETFFLLSVALFSLQCSLNNF